MLYYHRTDEMHEKSGIFVTIGYFYIKCLGVTYVIVCTYYVYQY